MDDNLGHDPEAFVNAPFCFHCKVWGESSDKGQRSLPSAFQLTQPNQFSKLAVIKEGTRKHGGGERSRFITHRAHTGGSGRSRRARAGAAEGLDGEAPPRPPGARAPRAHRSQIQPPLPGAGQALTAEAERGLRPRAPSPLRAPPQHRGLWPHIFPRSDSQRELRLGVDLSRRGVQS